MEGEFYDSQLLRVIPYTPDWSGSGCLGGYTLAVSEYSAPLTVRMRCEDGVSVYRPDGNGGWAEIPSSRDGHYLVFTLENGASFAAARREGTQLPLPLLIGGGALLLLLLLIVLIPLRRPKKRRKRMSDAR